MWASVGGAELAMRFGRVRILILVMGGSALLACGIGFAAPLPYSLVALLCVLYSLFVQGDSAALHAGTVQSAEPERRGATMAVQSLVGFASASLGPLVAGLVLDSTGGGNTVSSWGTAFIAMGAGVAMGPVILVLLARRTQQDGA
jgi:MFS family permease